MDLPTGTSNTAPVLASFTMKGLSSGRTPPPSLKLSKCTLAGDQWPVMSRTASISARGPQQYTWAVLGFSSTGQRSKARAGSPWLWFEGGAFASVSYNGYGHFDTDEWCDWIGEMGAEKSPEAYGVARRRLATVGSPEEEARLKVAGTYGGPGYVPPSADAPPAWHQHFGPVVVSCERADIRPLPHSVCVYGHLTKEWRPLGRPAVPRFEVIDELYEAVVNGTKPLHDGEWARSTLEVCLALLESAGSGKDVELLS